MNINAINSSTWELAANRPNPSSSANPIEIAARKDETDSADEGKLREAFQSFVGETLFSQMLKAARKTQNKPAYFHGGRAEEMFQQQLDQVLAEKIANSDGAKYSDAMFELFMMKRS